MNERLFLRTFGCELNLRVLQALHVGGESTIYRIMKEIGCSRSGFIQRRLREILMSLMALDLVSARTVPQLRPGTKLRAQPEVIRECVEYRLNHANPLTEAVCQLFDGG